MSAQGLSRRNFLKGLGTVGAAAAGATALAGYAPTGESESTASGGGTGVEGSAGVPEKAAMSADIWALEEAGSPPRTIDADVRIIGGGTSMAAAIEGAELGINVVLVERGGSLGGTFSATEGMFDVGSQASRAINSARLAMKNAVKYLG